MPTPRRTSTQKAEAAWLFVLGEPTRLAFVRALATGETTVTALGVACGVDMANASRHLRIMLDAGIVKSARDERDGRFLLYSLVGTTATATAVELTHPSGLKLTVPLA